MANRKVALKLMARRVDGVTHYRVVSMKNSTEYTPGTYIKFEDVNKILNDRNPAQHNYIDEVSIVENKDED